MDEGASDYYWWPMARRCATARHPHMWRIHVLVLSDLWDRRATLSRPALYVVSVNVLLLYSIFPSPRWSSVQITIEIRTVTEKRAWCYCFLLILHALTACCPWSRGPVMHPTQCLVLIVDRWCQSFSFHGPEISTTVIETDCSDGTTLISRVRCSTIQCTVGICI